MVFCSSCGKEMNDGAKFCNSCGANSQGSSAQLSSLGSQSNRIQVDMYDGTNWWDKYVYVIVAILTVLVMFIIGIALLE